MLSEIPLLRGYLYITSEIADLAAIRPALSRWSGCDREVGRLAREQFSLVNLKIAEIGLRGSSLAIPFRKL